MSSVVPDGWNIRLAENLFVREKVKVTHDRNSVSKRGSYPVIDQSEDGEIGFVDVLPEFDCSPQNPLVTFANHTCAVRKMTTPFGVIQNVFPLSSQVDSDINFVYQALLLAIEPEGYKGHYPKLRETEFLTPPLPEQKKIASILTSVDEVIENTQKQIDKLQDLKKATMNELLTKGIGHSEFKDSELGRIPNNWKVCSLGELGQIIDPHPSHRAPPEVNDGIPFLGIGDLKENGEFDTSKVRLVAREEILEHEKRYQISENTIGFGRVASIGKIIDFPMELKNVLISPTLAVIEPHSAQKKFLVNYLKSQLIINQLNFLITGSTRSSLGIQLLRELSILLPPLPEQKEIASILTSMDKNIEEKQHKLTQTQSLKKSLMQDLLTGKVRVTVN